MPTVRARLSQAVSVFATVMAHRSLRRIEVAFLGFSVAELATWVAILVFAFQHGGATEAGVLAVVQLVPSAVVAPLAAAFGDRYRRDRFLLYGYLIQAATMGTTGALMAWHAPVVAVYAGAVAAAVSVTLTRPAQGSIVPLLVERPEELIAVNVASGAIESASFVAGPAAAGLLIAASGPGLVFLAMAAAVGLSALLVARQAVTEPLAELVAEPVGEGPGEGRPDHPEVLRRSADGFRRLTRQADAALLVGLVASQALVIGAMDVLAIVLAISLLHLGPGAPGLLTAAIGAGGILGSGVGLVLITRRRLTPMIAVGAVLLGGPLAVTAWHPLVGLAAVMFAVAGVGRVVMDVAGRSLLQRAVSPDLLARAFGFMEGLLMAALAVGSITASGLVAAAGGRGALLVIGMLLPALAAATWLRLRRVEAQTEPPAHVVALFRRVPMFAQLPPLALDRLAASAEPVETSTGTTILRQGDPGDRLHVIARGSVEVNAGDRLVATLDAGQSFGEISLVRDVPRTASVVAGTDVLTYTLDRVTFLEVVSGHPASARAVDRVISSRTNPPA